MAAGRDSSSSHAVKQLLLAAPAFFNLVAGRAIPQQGVPEGTPAPRPTRSSSEQMDLKDEPSHAGLAVGVFFLVLTISGLGIALFLFYRRWSLLPPSSSTPHPTFFQYIRQSLRYSKIKSILTSRHKNRHELDSTPLKQTSPPLSPVTPITPASSRSEKFDKALPALPSQSESQSQNENPPATPAPSSAAALPPPTPTLKTRILSLIRRGTGLIRTNSPPKHIHELPGSVPPPPPSPSPPLSPTSKVIEIRLSSSHPAPPSPTPSQAARAVPMRPTSVPRLQVPEPGTNRFSTDELIARFGIPATPKQVIVRKGTNKSTRSTRSTRSAKSQSQSQSQGTRSKRSSTWTTRTETTDGEGGDDESWRMSTSTLASYYTRERGENGNP